MGINGFDLLKISDGRGFSIVMLTAHALTPEAFKESTKLAAVSFLPKGKMCELKEFLKDAASEGAKLIWKKSIRLSWVLLQQ